MRDTSASFVRHGRLAISLLLVLAPALAAQADSNVPAAAAAHTTGTTISVTNCNDRGQGSLRAAVAGAVSGDALDMRNLACNLITLTSGAIAIPQVDLVLLGPGFTRLAVSGNGMSSVFRHTGTGTLLLNGMTIKHGKVNALDAMGGCVYSGGSVDLYGVQVRHCAAFGAGYCCTQGGGLYVVGNLKLNYSALYSNRAVAGGGALVLGNLVANRAQILANVAPGRAGQGGGLRVIGSATISDSTVADNVSGWSGGGAQVFGSTYIANSTFSGNRAGESGGGLTTSDSAQKTIINSTFSGNTALIISAAQLTQPASIINSTFAYNRETNPFGCVAAVVAWGEIHVEGSILARNTCEVAQGWDVSWGTSESGSVVGANNIIESAFIPLPADTIAADPMLLPLADNGGRTLTHALRSGSRAIDQGSNVAGLVNDQRGPGFPRVVGTRPDVGAYERER